jgi:uncharacterized protein DUF3617
MRMIGKGTLLWIPAVLFVLSATAHATVLPNFRPGLWEFERTVNDPAAPGGPQTMKAQKCVDPKVEMQSQNRMLKQIGCTVTPLTQMGQVYHFKATCRFPNGSLGTSVTDLTYESDSAYSAKIESEGMSRGGKTHEELRAKRIGDCQ